MPRIVSFRLDDALDHAIEVICAQHGLTQSQVIRALLRRSLAQAASTFDNGFREGIIAGQAQYLAQIGTESAKAAKRARKVAGISEKRPEIPEIDDLEDPESA